jgi:hypothetical protein
MTKNANLGLTQAPDMSHLPHNKTTLFMLPAIGFKEEKTSLKLLKYYGFVNCYLSHVQSPVEYTDCLTLIFNPSVQALEKFKDFYKVYRTYSNFVTDYTIDHRLIALVFRVLPRWGESLKAFRESKYSKMAKEYADLFKNIDMATGKVLAGPEYFIMRKDPEYRKYLEDSLSNRVGKEPPSLVKINPDAELMSALDLNKEHLNYALPR